MQQIAETTARLFGASSVSIQIAEGSEFTQEYRVGAIAKRVGSAYPRSNIKVGGRNLPGTVVAESRQIHIPDLDRLDPSMSDFPGLPHARASGARTVCGTPLRRGHKAIGALIVFRDRLLPFTADELAVLQSFADQAVIAIRNAQSFNETQAALERQTATSEILRVISQSPTDVQPVFDAIVETAVRLTRCDLAFFLRCDGATYVQVARATPEGLTTVTRPPEHIDPDGNFPSRAIFGKKTLHLPDWSLIDLPKRELWVHETFGIVSSLYLPLLRAGECVGLLVLAGKRINIFGDREVALAESFRDQALIAIENTRLFKETQQALERQTATSEILRVISQSPTDVQPVFDAIVETAVRLIRCEVAFVLRCDGATFSPAAAAGPDGPLPDLGPSHLPIDPALNFPSRAIVGKENVYLPDWSLIDLPEHERQMRALIGVNSSLFLPLLREGECIGVLALADKKTNIFGDSEIALAESFRDQALIAIENTRLFNEVEQRTEDLRESLQQQTATAEVLNVISNSPGELGPVFRAVLENATRICDARFGTLLRFAGNAFHFATDVGTPAALAEYVRRPGPFQGLPGGMIDRILKTRQIQHTADYAADPAPGLAAKLGGARSALGVPILKDDVLVGAIVIYRQEVRPFSVREIELVRSFAAQAAIAIENARLFNETKEALERQTATADILKVIASSPDDVQPVFQAIAERSNQLVGGFATTVVSILDDVVHLSAFTSTNPAADAALRAFYPRPLSGFSYGDAVRRGETHRIVDIELEPGLEPDQLTMVRQRGWRSALWVPLLLEGMTIGAIGVTRVAPGAFADHHVDMLKTFADQAVIAISNVKLFREVQARTRELTEALTYQTGSSNILRVIASSPTDVTPVLQAIVESACALCEANDAIVYLRDGNDLRFNAQHGSLEFTVDKWPIDRATAAGRTFLDRAPVHIHDMLSEEGDQFPEGQRAARRIGVRTMLGVPLLREGESIGTILLRRTEVHPFSDKQVTLLQTFADQAVIAIGNARLFEEVQAKTQELSRSLDDLRAAQDRLVQTEKLASLGQLTAGIAHEIKNPLNFVNNFSALSAELIDEMNDVFENPDLDEAGRRKELDEIRELLKSNLEKVVQHGKRADSIVKNMLLHSREGSSEQRTVDINALLDESLNLAYHGARAEKPGFNITLQRDLDPDAGMIELFPQEITRVLLNLISNGFYAASKRGAENGEANYEPVLSAATRNLGNDIEIRIRDNGTGIPPEVKEKMFNPFFTTKPAGEGTGLGLSMSHDIIVKQHGGRIEVDTQPGHFTEFTIVLPRTTNPANNRKN
ncbi:GAF domain-containing protein [Bradyrhizobium sp. WYCCWR 13022]|uniref:GAF domain-containing protein n=1 Tax=unclassified Bradyrhizobium TaxID=2631580 RepID=UPI00263B8017|nr:GAF domain-containing protein [Bradyrhizobium sp. WYCCWR 13022]MDN4988466.1 GAF domain-containing protein [Bradyrhizobium sp. WYCCWR 13022]